MATAFFLTTSAVQASCGEAKVKFKCKDGTSKSLTFGLCYKGAACRPCSSNEEIYNKVTNECPKGSKCWESVKASNVAGGLGNGIEDDLIENALNKRNLTKC